MARSPSYRHRVKIMEPVGVQNATTGEVVTYWQPLALTSEITLDAVPADVLTGPGREFREAGAVRSEVSLRVSFRWFDGLLPTHRIEWEGLGYDIFSIERDFTGRREYRVACRGEGETLAAVPTVASSGTTDNAVQTFDAAGTEVFDVVGETDTLNQTFDAAGTEVFDVVGETDTLNQTFDVASSYTAPYTGSWALVGSGLARAATSTPALATLSSTSICIARPDDSKLYKYNWSGSAWALDGTAAAHGGYGGFNALCGLTSTRVAFIDSSAMSLRAYDWNGSTWVLVGSGLTISGASPSQLAALNSTDVAYISITGDLLQVYRFNGSTWSKISTDLSIVHSDRCGLAALSSSQVALYSSTLGELRTYEWNGSSWSQVGSGLAISDHSSSSIAALSSTMIAICSPNSDKIETFTWNGSTWSALGSGTALTMTGVSICALNSTDIAHNDVTTDQLRTYRLS